jgi:hypothetical protein
MTARTDDRGSALLLAILATAILGAGLMSVLVLSGSERRAVMNQQAQTDAFAVAQTGLEQFVANRAALGFTSSPAAAVESTRVTVSGGYADVVLQRLRPAVGSAPAMYVLRSTGYSTGPQLSGTPLAERQVSQLASWASGGMSVQAAFTGIMGITKSTTTGTISGADNCGVNAAIAGVAVPSSPGYVQSGSQVPSGSPAILSYGSVALTAAAVRIDWNGIVNGTAVTPSVTLPGGTWPASFPSTVWPVIRVNGNYTMPTSGQGTLIVTGTLTMGAKTWKGVILVGDAFKTSSSATVLGTVVAGLNYKLGQTPTVSALTGANVLRYNACNIASTMAGYGGLALVPNAWADNWAGW